MYGEFKLLVMYMKTAFYNKCPEAMHFKNDLAQTKSKPWYKFII